MCNFEFRTTFIETFTYIALRGIQFFFFEIYAVRNDI